MKVIFQTRFLFICVWALTGVFYTPLCFALPTTNTALQTNLTQLFDRTLKYNPTIQRAQAELERRHGVVMELRGALLPTLKGVGLFQHTDQSRIPTFADSTFGTQETWTADVLVTQTLFAGGTLYRQFNAGKDEQEAARLSLLAVTNQVLASTHRHYLDLLLAREQILVEEENVRLLDHTRADQQSRFDVGDTSRFGVLQAEVALANARPALIRARQQVAVAEAELQESIGITESLDPSLISQPLPRELPPVFTQDIVSTALNSRPELQQLNKQVSAAKEGVRAARGGYLPRADAQVGYGADKSRLTQSSREYDEGLRAGVNLEWKLFDSMATQGRVAQAEALANRARAELDAKTLAITVEARKALSAIEEASELLNASHKVIEQAQEAYRLAKERASVGAATQLELLDSEVALTKARTNELFARHSVQTALATVNEVTAGYVR
jgi:outer membrane protein